MREDEEATIRTLTAQRAVISSLIRQHRGHVIDSPGDNLLAEFASVVDAVRCAVEVQKELTAKNAELPHDRRMSFRIGINLGDVVVDGERIYGDGVNIAARLESLATPGGICISGSAYDQVETKQALTYEDLGEQTVKNITKPVRVYRIVMDGAGGQRAPRSRYAPSRLLPARRWVLVALLLAAASLGVVEYWFPTLLSFRPGASGPEPLPLPDKPSLVVLPFDNMTNDPEQEYFSDGMTEDLTTDLSKISSLFVIARHSAFTYKGKRVKVQEVGRELGVWYVLEGSVRRADDRVRINAQLVDAATGRHLWTERFDRPYDLFLRGRVYFFRLTKDANIQARQMYEQALALDPNYADACAWLAWTYWNEWIYQWSPNPAQSLERFVELAHRAIALDDSVPEPHVVLGYAYLFKDRRYAEAIAEIRHAVNLEPNNGELYLALADVLNFSAQHEEALEAIRKAMRLNPHYPAFYPWQLGFAYSATGQTEKALAALKRTINLNPDFLGAHLLLASLYIDLGRKAEARAEAAEESAAIDTNRNR